MGQPGRGNARSSRAEFIGAVKRTRGSETSQYPLEEKSIEIPSVAASERGRAQTSSSDTRGVVGLSQGAAREVIKPACSRRSLERPTTEGDSPVDETRPVFLETVPEYRGTRAIPRESGGTILQG